MLRFSLKVLIFLIPLIILNLFLLSFGFLFHQKNEYIINKLANYVPPTNTVNFLFIGSSRINCGISPDDFASSFNKLGIKVSATNLGIDATPAYLGLILARNNLKKYDYIIIEIFPGNPLISLSPYLIKKKPFQTINDYLNFNLENFSAVQNLYSILLYWLNRNSTYYIDCHNNGFSELKLTSNYLSLMKTKHKWVEEESKSEQSSPSLAINYYRYLSYIKILIKNSKTKIIFITMPVDGKLAEYQSFNLTKFNPTCLFVKYFPDAINIKSSNDSILSQFHTADDSHMDGKTAKEFSIALGKLVISKAAIHR